MFTAKVTELSRGTAHERQVAYVRASLLQGIDYGRKEPRGSDRILRSVR